MDLAWLRDLTIVVWGGVSVVVLAVLTVLAVAFYRRLKTVLNHVEVTTANLARLSETAREAAVPLLQLASLVQVVTRVLEAIKGLGKNSKEEAHG